jgi:hypothetical protein
MSEFSLKIVPFGNYASVAFKKVLYELYVNKQLGPKSPVLKLLDSYIYGFASDLKVFVLLFERTTSSLANVAEYRK